MKNMLNLIKSKQLVIRGIPEINKKDEPRISISADILLTMKKGISTEHCIPHPSQWASI